MSHHEKKLKDFNLFSPTVNINSLHSFLHFCHGGTGHSLSFAHSKQHQYLNRRKKKLLGKLKFILLAKPSVLNIVTETLKCMLQYWRKHRIMPTWLKLQCRVCIPGCAAILRRMFQGALPILPQTFQNTALLCPFLMHIRTASAPETSMLFFHVFLSRS